MKSTTGLRPKYKKNSNKAKKKKNPIRKWAKIRRVSSGRSYKIKAPQETTSLITEEQIKTKIKQVLNFSNTEGIF